MLHLCFEGDIFILLLYFSVVVLDDFAMVDVTPQQLSFTASGGSVDLQVSGTQELYLIIDSIPPAATLSGKVRNKFVDILS